MAEPSEEENSKETRTQSTAQCISSKLEEDDVDQHSEGCLPPFLRKLRGKSNSKAKLEVNVNTEDHILLNVNTEKKGNQISIDIPKDYQLQKLEHSDQKTSIKAIRIEGNVTKSSPQDRDYIQGSTENFLICLNEFTGFTDHTKRRPDEGQHSLKDFLGDALIPKEPDVKSLSLDDIKFSIQTDGEIEEDESVSVLHGEFKAGGMTFICYVFTRERKIKSMNTFSVYFFGTNKKLSTRKIMESSFSLTDMSPHNFTVLHFSRSSYQDKFEVFQPSQPYRLKDIISLFKDKKKTKSMEHSLFSEKRNSAVSIKKKQRTCQETDNDIVTHSMNELRDDEQKVESPVISDETSVKRQTTETVISKNINPVETHTELDEPNSEKHLEEPILLRHQHELRPEIRKSKQSKVIRKSTYRPPKLYTLLEEIETHEDISEFLKDEIIRGSVNDFFQKRPHVTWPSMHPMLPVKVRYLDTSSTERVNIKTTSSPPSSESSDENDSDESSTEQNIDKAFHPP